MRHQSSAEPVAVRPHPPTPSLWHRLRRRLLPPARATLMDLPTWLDRGERALARRRGPDAALLLFVFDELHELDALYGDRVRRSALREVASGLRRVAGSRGLAARTGSVEFCVLLPGVGPERALETAHAVLGRPCRLELDAGEDELVLVPDLLAEACPRGHGGLTALHGVLRQRVLDHQHLRRLREHHLRRSRERYSRPGKLAGTAPQPASDSR